MLDTSAEIIVVVALGVLFTVYSRGDMDPEKAIPFDGFATVCWIVVALLWLFGAAEWVVSLLFVGFGVVMALYTVMDTLDFLRQRMGEATGRGREETYT